MYSAGLCVLLILSVLSLQKHGVFQLKTLCSEMECSIAAKSETAVGLNYWARDRRATVEECCSSLLAVEGQVWAYSVICSVLESSNTLLAYDFIKSCCCTGLV